ncbi:MAG: uroporphyrinogen decarboxylase family protein [Planctomycetota bacterium]
MTAREKMLAAFSPSGAPEVPATICYEGIMVRDHWEEVTDRPWWFHHSYDLDEQMQWRRDLVARVPQDWIQSPPCASREQRRIWRLDVRPGGVFWVNTRTGREQQLKRPAVSGWSEGRALHSHHPARLIETVAEINEQIPTPPDIDAHAFVEQGRDDLALQIRKEFPDLCLLGGATSPLWQCYGVWGFEGMMTMIADRPDLVEHACRRALPEELNRVRQDAACGADAVWIEECFTDMVSPDAFRRLNLPFIRAIADEVRALGMKSVYYFCGNPAGKWDLLLDAGADALSLEESKKGFDIDIEDVVNHVQGRCTVFGNLDAINLLPNGTEARLRAEIERQIAAGRCNGGRFIMGLGSPVTPETPIERVRLYCEMAHEIGSRHGQG